MADTNDDKKKRKMRKKDASGGAGGFIYTLGLIGSLVYFIQHAESFWAGVLGVLQAIVWPAVLVYKLLESIAA